MADVMDQDYYAAGHYIIRQGEKVTFVFLELFWYLNMISILWTPLEFILQGDAFFVINSGTVKVTQLIEGETEPREIRILNQVCRLTNFKKGYFWGLHR